MILISHRGNINGRIEEAENRPDYIDDTIKLGYEVEIDVWVIEGTFYLGHDEPQYGILMDWLYQRKDKLWIHCKNIEAVEWLNSLSGTYNYFWHQNDVMTLTSKGYIWSNIGYYLQNGITVSLEYKKIPTYVRGVCSDYVSLYQNG